MTAEPRGRPIPAPLKVPRRSVVICLGAVAFLRTLLAQASQTPAPLESKATDVNGDGSVIIGVSGSQTGPLTNRRGFVWTEPNGLEDLRQVFTERQGLGPAPVGWHLGYPFDISSNGHFIVGTGQIQKAKLKLGWFVLTDRWARCPSRPLRRRQRWEAR
jgi:hypothetical protein